MDDIEEILDMQQMMKKEFFGIGINRDVMRESMLYNFNNRKLGYHLVAFDANNPTGQLLGTMSAIITTDVYARGGKSIWG